MADAEKGAAVSSHGASDSSDVYVNTTPAHSLPSSYKYRSLKLGGKRLPFYASPPVQLLMVSFVCFLCPGMFNALSGLGGGGQVDKTAANNANTALYSTFSVVGFFAGTFVNYIGVKFSLSFGGFGYCLYVASFLSYNHNQNEGFNIFAGAMLGVCAGILWSAQGAIMMSYPAEENKGKYISWFWMIFNLGAVIGALIPLGENIHVRTNSTVTDGTYIAFLVLTFFGGVLAWFLVDAKDVIRNDGSRVIVMKHPTWKSELWGLWLALQQNPWIIALFPMFWSSNWFYNYQFNDVNAARFNTRTKSLNDVLYWTSQIVGASIFGYFLDFKMLSRSMRAKIGWAALFVLTMAIWGGGYAFQSGYTRATAEADMDWTHSGYVGPMFLYMFYGFYDAAWQTCVYWFMGAMSNNGRLLANYAGFYKGIQSAGAAVMPALDNEMIPYMNLFASCWALLAGSLLIAAPLVFTIRDHIPLEEDLKNSDETMAEVAPNRELESEK